jgi:CDP-glucose 4,6-dehydratase
VEGVEVKGFSPLRGRRVLVTGHTGFKGGWLCRILERLGANVTGYSLPPPTRPSLFEEAALGDGLTSRIADVRDLAQLKSAFADASPEVVFHLAAQPLVRAAHSEPVETFETNVLGTVNVLEAARGCADTRAVVVATTDKVYRNEEWSWGYREIDALGGDEAYSASKAGAELVTAAYRASYFRTRSSPCGVATVRAGNVIGGGDWAVDRIVPDLVRAATARTRVEIRNPRATRPWQHVLDPLFGYLELAARLLEEPTEFDQAWNFGPFSEGVRPVWDLAERLGRAFDVPIADVSSSHVGPKEAHSLTLDSSKAVQRLGWRPLFDFDQAIDLTRDWYVAWLRDRTSARRVLDEQITLALERSP